MINEFDYLVFTIIFCDINLCKEELRGYLNDGEEKYYFFESSQNLKSIYFPSPPKGGAHLCKISIWEPKNLKGASCFFSKYSDGRYTLILNFCKSYNHKAVRVAFSNKENESTTFMLDYFDFSDNNEIERYIYLLKDDTKWNFFTKGEPLYFENVKNYIKRKKVERFNKIIMLEYLQKLGIDINSEQFWESYGKSVYFSQLKW